jgi:hypothetical protein
VSSGGLEKALGFGTHDGTHANGIVINSGVGVDVGGKRTFAAGAKPKGQLEKSGRSGHRRVFLSCKRSQQR